MPAIIMRSGLQSGGGGTATVLRARGRDRVEARGAQRPAACQAADREPEPAAAAVLLDRLSRVLRTAREEAARRRPALESPLIGGDRAQHQALETGSGIPALIAFARSCCSSIRSWSNVSSTARGVAPINSTPPGSVDCVSR